MTSSRSRIARVARVAHAVDLLVPRGVLLDVGVGAGDVGFGLVVVVVADEILDRVVREEALELAVELGGQGLVVGEDQGRPLGRLDDLGHGEGLAGAGDAQQHLVPLALLDARHQLGDGGGLVAGGLVVGRPARTAGRPRTSPAARAGAAPTGWAWTRFDVVHERRRHVGDAGRGALLVAERGMNGKVGAGLGAQARTGCRIRDGLLSGGSQH